MSGANDTSQRYRYLEALLCEVHSSYAIKCDGRNIAGCNVQLSGVRHPTKTDVKWAERGSGRGRYERRQWVLMMKYPGRVDVSYFSS